MFTCEICDENQDYINIKCKKCLKNICNLCFSRLIYNTKKCIEYEIETSQIEFFFACPYCRSSLIGNLDLYLEEKLSKTRNDYINEHLSNSSFSHNFSHNNENNKIIVLSCVCKIVCIIGIIILLYKCI